MKNKNKIGHFLGLFIFYEREVSALQEWKNRELNRLAAEVQQKNNEIANLKLLVNKKNLELIESVTYCSVFFFLFLPSYAE